MSLIPTKLAAGALALPLAAGVAVYFAFPGLLVKGTQWLAARKAGLTRKVLGEGDDAVHYYEGGSGPVLMLLHGMADEKNSFAQAAAELTGRFRVILPDLKGHGENARVAGAGHTIRDQVAFLARFVDGLALDRFTLGGNSMGGHTAAAYTLAYPERIEALILVNAAGFEIKGHMVYGGFGSPLQGRADLARLMQRVFHTPPKLPGPVADKMIADVNRDLPFTDAMARQIREGADHRLNERYHEIAVPTLLVWGRSDEVVPLAAAAEMERLIDDATLVVVEEAAHSPQLEKPVEIGREIRVFLEGAAGVAEKR
ncbi:alpha/beta fold hydrolase [Qipengyuania qiaonensis]|uniref:Alpha/beta fold hydrolase n=1 Tax=Qipengyuania qiaonensis TaxID=2867240 RepID=A0ABS7J1D3_9SPHN|nr:alpha/beta fold hydrolase [Qipengyuania qiaonensis]MBX7481133.1 alpha/beta fold hydrolase [Qipengyuania qiaonensis]